MDENQKMLAKATASIEEFKANNTKIVAELELAQKETGKTVTDAIARADVLSKEQAKISAALDDIEQRIAANVIKGTTPIETLGQSVIKSDAFKGFVAGNTNKLTVNANTVTGQEGSPPENSNTLVRTDRVSGIIGGAFRNLLVKDVLLHGNTTSNAVEFTRELAFTNNAAETAEGAAIPESDLTFELATANVRNIGHFIKVSKQVLDDAEALASYIDTRLRYGTDLKFDAQLLNGDGTGQNLSGMTIAANRTAFTAVTGENALDSVSRMIEQVATADYQATAIMMNPADWFAIERLKNGASDARYVVGDPNRMGQPVLWGLPVVVSNSVTAGNALVAAFDVAYQVWNRKETTVEMYAQDSDNATKGLLTVTSEKRSALASYRAASAVYGGLTL